MPAPSVLGGALVVSKQPTQPFSDDDFAGAAQRAALDQLIAEALVIAFEVVVDALALRYETPTLFVREPEPPPIELLLEDAVLFDEVLEDLLLLAVDPSANARNTIRNAMLSAVIDSF